MKHDLTRHAKIAFTNFVALVCRVGWIFPISYVVVNFPWWAIISVWLVGAIVTHVWLYRGLAGPKPRLNDFSLYYQDSGIAIVILLWPLFFGAIEFPEIARSFAERMVGIRWHQGERRFD